MMGPIHAKSIKVKEIFEDERKADHRINYFLKKWIILYLFINSTRNTHQATKTRSHLDVILTSASFCFFPCLHLSQESVALLRKQLGTPHVVEVEMPITSDEFQEAKKEKKEAKRRDSRWRGRLWKP